jgi:hypothetical protein
MNRDLTDNTLVVDHSGSMESIWTNAEGGVNAFLRQQAELPGRALIRWYSSTMNTSFWRREFLYRIARVTSSFPAAAPRC